ncbi:MAG: T9SS type A sorting domain-containing protein [Calditrichaeota bacterium]|nr:T9SS type A sorting domain-containing protein [Calditrichota bacterium]
MVRSLALRALILLAAGLVARNVPAHAQGNPYTIELTRGRLWHSFYLSQECEPMADWSRKTYGLDWPGFASEEIKQNIGGHHTYLLAGGFFLTAKTDTGTVWGWDNFATHGTDVGIEGDQFRYLISKDSKGKPVHRRRWQDGNYWLLRDPFEAEEVIDTQWEMNGAWYQPWDNQNMPVLVRRTVRQWSGSRADEDYVIIEYVVKNTQRRKSLNGVYLLFTYALSPNHRGWSLVFPNFPEGARNTHSEWDPERRLLTAWAGDFALTPGNDESFDFFQERVYDPVQGRAVVRSRFLAPGCVGIKFLYVSPDTSGQANRINGFAWSAAPPTNDHSGPFLGVAGLTSKYAAMANPLLLSEAFADPTDPRMGQNRLYANFSLGPYNLARGDSVKVVVAEFVGGLPYEKADNPLLTTAELRAAGDSAVTYLEQRVSFAYEHQYTVPMPPPAPRFVVYPVPEGGRVGNVISFSTEVESVPDPHHGVPDVAGYRIYRSGQFPFGPWKMLVDIPVGDPRFFDADSQRYIYVDSEVALGYAFYYSVTSYDHGWPAWAVDPSYEVPPLESSIFANRMRQPFYTTLRPTEKKLDEVTVVPNPFYRSSGFELAGDVKLIQFVNLSEECTIRIYTVRGDLVKTIHHRDPSSGVAFWNQISDYGQYVKSGMYFFQVTNQQGEVKLGKFAIIN